MRIIRRKAIDKANIILRLTRKSSHLSLFSEEFAPESSKLLKTLSEIPRNREKFRTRFIERKYTRPMRRLLPLNVTKENGISERLSWTKCKGKYSVVAVVSFSGKKFQPRFVA